MDPVRYASLGVLALVVALGAIGCGGDPAGTYKFDGDKTIEAAKPLLAPLDADRRAGVELTLKMTKMSLNLKADGAGELKSWAAKSKDETPSEVRWTKSSDGTVIDIPGRGKTKINYVLTLPRMKIVDGETGEMNSYSDVKFGCELNEQLMTCARLDVKDLPPFVFRKM